MALKYQIQVDDQGNAKIVQLGKNIQETDKKAQSFGSTLKGVLGAELIMKGFEKLSEGAKKAWEEFNKVSEEAHNLELMAQKTGASVEFLSEFGYAAKLAGVEMLDMQMAFKKLSKDMDTGSAVFNRLGIATKDASGAVRPMSEVMLDVADRFSKMDDGATKAALAQELFGRQGMNLIPVLNKGREALAGQIEEAKKLGVAWDEAGVEKGAAFREGMERLTAAFEGLTKTAALPLMEKLTPAIENLINTIGNNKDKIAGFVDAFGGGLLDTMQGILDVITALPTPVNVAATAIIALGVAFKTMGGPLTWAAAAIAAVGFAVGKLDDYIKESAMGTEKYAESVKSVAQAEEGLAYVDKSLPAARNKVLSLYNKENADVGDIKEAERVVAEMTNAQSAYKSYLAAHKIEKKTGTYTPGENPEKVKVGRTKTFGEFSGYDFGIKAGPMTSISEHSSDMDSIAKAESDRLEAQQKASDKMVEAWQQEQDLKYDMMQEGADKEIALFEANAEQKYATMQQMGVAELTLTEYIEQGKQNIRSKYNAQGIQTIGSMIGALGNLNQAMKGNAEATKGLLIGETIMNTAAAIMKFMVDPGGLLGFGLSVTAGITGAAQIATIASQKFAIGGWAAGPGNSTSDSIMAVSNGERIVSGSEVAQAGGRAAIDRALDFAKGRARGAIQLVISGPVDRGYLRDVLIPELSAELGRA